MYRFLLRPKWLAFHLLVVAMVVVMVNLAFWQLHRLQDRREFNDEVRSRAALPVAEFTDVVVPGVDPADVEWRTVTVTGTYLADEQVLAINRSQGGFAGRNVVTPLALDDGTLVLVNRGFVAEAEPVPAPTDGTVTVTGRLRESERRRLGGLTDPADVELTEVQRIDIDRIAAQLPGDVAPVYVDLRSAEPSQGSSPIPVPDPELTEGPHLSYMVQWFVFAACVVAGWVLAVRHSVRKRTRDAGLVPAAPPTEPATPH